METHLITVSIKECAHLSYFCIINVRNKSEYTCDSVKDSVQKSVRFFTELQIQCTFCGFPLALK